MLDFVMINVDGCPVKKGVLKIKILQNSLKNIRDTVFNHCYFL